MRLSAGTRFAGVIGSPARASLSPLIHNAWLAATGIDAVYLALETPADRFASAIEGLNAARALGVNVTAPFKQDALRLASSATDFARRAGAANLLCFSPDGTAKADNTDGVGLMQAFAGQSPDFDPTVGPVVLFGAGGAARAAALAFLDAGAPQVRIVNRDRQRGSSLAGLLSSKGAFFPEGEARVALAGANAIINATPQSPLIELEAAPSSAVVMDMVYRPVKTAFLARADGLGMPTVDGLAMLIAQARPSFEALFGAPAPDLDVRSLALTSLAGEG